MTATSRPPVRTDTQRPAVNRKHITGHKPGDVQAYRNGCRCYPCCRAKSAYHKQQRADDWNPYVDVAPIRDHIEHLDANGVGTMRVAELAGVDRATIQGIRGLGSRKPHVRVHTEIAARILAIRPDIDTVKDAGHIDSTGTYRRLTSLIALGFPPPFLAERRSGRRDWVRQLDDFPATVTGAFARSVRSLFEQLESTPADELARRFKLSGADVADARRRGAANDWPLPIDWYAAEIDDPNAQPHRARRIEGGDERPVTEAEAADVAFVLHTTRIKEGEAVKDYRERVAKRLEIDPKRLEYIITRKLPKLEQAGRRDRDEMAVAA